MKKAIVYASLLFAGTVFAGNFWPNSGFEAGAGGDPEGYRRAGQDKEMQCWGGPSAAGSYSLGLVDANTDKFASWMSDKVPLPAGTAGTVITIRWKELFEISGRMRVTVIFRDASNDSIKGGGVHMYMKGTSDGWGSGTFTEASREVDVPLHAVEMQITFTSSGGTTATGKCYIDDLEVIRLDAATSLSKAE